jgi:NADH-quinone oxidoreductase subunit A
MLYQYIPIAFLAALSFGLAIAFTFVAVYVGPRKPSREKQEPFECGNKSEGHPKTRFSIKFYVVAVIFLVFDIEAVFFFPWAVEFRELSRETGLMFFYGAVEMGLFLFVLALALWYAWRKGGLEWD